MSTWQQDQEKKRKNKPHPTFLGMTVGEVEELQRKADKARFEQEEIKRIKEEIEQIKKDKAFKEEYSPEEQEILKNSTDILDAHNRIHKLRQQREIAEESAESQKAEVYKEIED